MIRSELQPGGVGVVTLDRPEKKNAMTPAMMSGFAAAIDDLGRRARVLVVAGAGDAFCAGFDLTLCKDTSDALRDLLVGLSDAMRLLRRLPVPVVAAAQGAAIAGGCALLGACDVVVTDAQAKLGYPVVKLGISPAVNAPFLALAMSGGRTRERLLDTRLISGREAAAGGLAHECVATPAEVLPRALALAGELGAKPAHGLSATKAWLNELDGSDSDRWPDAALRASLELVGLPEERARLAALWS